MADHDLNTKLCKGCNLQQSKTHFFNASAAPDGLQRRCKTCMKASKREDYYRNLEKSRARERARVRNKDQLRQASARWRERHPELFKSRIAAWTQRNRVKRNATIKAWKAANPEKMREMDARRRASKVNAPGNGWTVEDVAAIRLAQKNKCAICRVTLGKRIHRDHIVPLFRGGAHCRRNLQLLCEPCNLSKGARDPIDHARTLGLLL